MNFIVLFFFFLPQKRKSMFLIYLLKSYFEVFNFCYLCLFIKRNMHILTSWQILFHFFFEKKIYKLLKSMAYAGNGHVCHSLGMQLSKNVTTINRMTNVLIMNIFIIQQTLIRLTSRYKSWRSLRYNCTPRSSNTLT